jgi:hypothetical protein
MLVAEGAAEAAFDASGLAIWDCGAVEGDRRGGGRPLRELPVSWNGVLDLSELR